MDITDKLQYYLPTYSVYEEASKNEFPPERMVWVKMRKYRGLKKTELVLFVFMRKTFLL